MQTYKVTQYACVALRSLLNQKLRSLLSVLGVVCGVMAVAAMISVGEGARRATIHQIERLGTKNIYIKALALTDNQMVKARERLSPGLTITDRQRIENGCRTVDKIACLREISTSILGLSREMSPQVVACSADYAQLIGLHISSGRFLAPQDGWHKNLVCVLGSEVARRLEGVGRPGAFIRMNQHLFKVVGILNRIEPQTDSVAAVSSRNTNEMVFIPLETADTVDSHGNRPQKMMGMALQLSEIIIQVDRVTDVLPTAILAKRIMDVAHHQNQDYQFVVPLELLKQAEKTQRTFNLVLGTIAGISLLVGGIGIMNIMLATVSERTREIGIRRAVGATRGHIVIQFLMESVMLTVTGGIIGLFFGLGAVGAIYWLAGWQVAISTWAVASPLIMSLLVGIFFGLYPALHAAQVAPIVALRRD